MMFDDAINLLCVVGMTPAVVTETVYALCVAGQSADAEQTEAIQSIVVITTSSGRAALEPVVAEQILAMAEDYPVARSRLPIDADGSVRLAIHVPRDLAGQELEDVRSEVDNALMADAIHARVREMTIHGSPRLHASLAGGRKTMGYLLGNAMMLFARDSDRLSHVLAGSNAERCQEFFYPTPTTHMMASQNGEDFDASIEPVEICEIPFIRLRHIVENRATLPDSHFDLIGVAQEEIFGEQKLVVDFEVGAVRWGAHGLGLTPVQTAFFMVLAAEHRAGRTPILLRDVYAEERLGPILRDVYSEVLNFEGTGFFDSNRNVENVRAQISQLRRTLARRFPEHVVHLLQPQNCGKRGDPQYTLKIEARHIDVRGAEWYPGEAVEPS
ncbi:MAG: CRISPR-associated ring nuclease Csm6 [Bradymonadaceae bacterium]